MLSSVPALSVAQKVAMPTGGKIEGLYFMKLKHHKIIDINHSSGYMIYSAGNLNLERINIVLSIKETKSPPLLLFPPASYI